MMRSQITGDALLRTSPACQDFLGRWSALRGGALVPAFEDFIDGAPAAYIPSCYILEFKDTGAAIVRFQGTELVERWRRDFTGSDIHATLPHFARARSLANMLQVVMHPCGLLGRSSAVTQNGRTVVSDYILLPLAVGASQDRRLITFLVKDTSAEQAEPVTKFYRTLNSAWFNIGAGVPAEPPLELDT